MRDTLDGRAFSGLRRCLARGELVGLIYRLGRHAASGVLTVSARGARPEVLVLRRGHAVATASPTSGGARSNAERCGGTIEEAARKLVATRLAQLVGQDDLVVTFEGGVAACPPGAVHQLALATWARAHLEQQLDGSLAEQIVHQLAGVRLAIRPELAPAPADEADRRMLAAMAQPRRLDQIWPLARTPRFRLLAFLHFLRAVDALEAIGIAAERSAPVRGADARRSAALRALGVTDGAAPEDVKRAYRRLARALHPDLQPEADGEHRRALERRFAEITAAYESLS